MIVLESPTVARLVGWSESEIESLKKKLTYTDQKVSLELKKFKYNNWFIQKYGEEAFIEKLQELKDQVKKCILFEDDKGYWIYSGLATRIGKEFDHDVVNQLKTPKSKLIPWAKEPGKSMRYYQQAALEKLLDVKHGAVSIGTGLGKSFIILNLCKQLGLKTVVMAPSDNIAKQLFDEFKTAFGAKNVGFFGDGKKQADKIFTIAIAASLVRVKEGSEQWDHLSSAQVFISDESHLTPAKTLSSVCFGLLAAAPFRFFFSATQMRGDGLDLILEGIIGPIVYEMSVKEGVDQGFLAKPVFRMIKTKSELRALASDDANNLTRYHLYYNPKIVNLAADLANKSVGKLNKPTLILVDEIEQFTRLLPHFRYPAKFAHGPLTAEQKKLLPPEYHESNPKGLVESFNRLEYPILVGTSCICIGTDIQAVQTCIWLRGGKSEVEVCQGVGRCTRLAPGKEQCVFFDFMLEDNEVMNRHALYRRSYYEELYPSYQEMKIG